MSALLLHQSQTRPDTHALADELIAASYAHPTDKVIVAGGNHLELLIAFLRRGFLDAACISTGRELHAIDAADILIAPVLDAAADLPEILNCLGGALRPGGVLVIRATESLAVSTEQQLLPIFLQFGFAAVERLASRNHDGEVWLARKQIKIMAKAA